MAQVHEKYDQSRTNVSNQDISILDGETTLDSLQSRYEKLANNSHSRIPVKTRQPSGPVPLLDESAYGNNIRKSSIPRITTSPTSQILTPTASLRKRTNLSPIDNTPNINEAGSRTKEYLQKGRIANTTTSPMSQLSNKIGNLSLTSPGNKIDSSTPIHSPKVRKESKPLLSIPRSNTSSELSRIAKSVDSRSTSGHCLKDRTSDMLKSRFASSDCTQQNNISKKAIQPQLSPSKRSISTRTQKKIVTSYHEDSPLIQRLTRSTTASDLKTSTTLSVTSLVNTRKKRNVSGSPSKPKQSTMTRSQSFRRIPREGVNTASSSVLEKQKRNCQQSQEASSVRQQTKPSASNEPQSADRLRIPKKRTMTKSHTINNGISHIANPPTASLRVPSISSSRKPSSTKTMGRSSSQKSIFKSASEVSKLRDARQLCRVLKTNPKTRLLIDTYYKQPEFSNATAKSKREIMEESRLNVYEKAEISKTSEVFYVSPIKNNTSLGTSNYLENFGFDDEEKNLILNARDHINYRYEVIANLGKGMFGNVFKCTDHKLQKSVVVKIMKNDVNWSLQSINEIKILKKLQGHANILKYYENFNFRSHICIATESLSVNLLEVLNSVNNEGFEIDVIKHWSRQLLSGLEFIHSHNIIHADLKPENIMLVRPDSFDLKIIDFGSSCKVDEITYPYIQSRFYRAPEVLLGCRYDTKIDIWSFITLIYEMYCGKPLFAVNNERQLFESIVKLIGHPSHRTILDLRNDLFKYGSVNKTGDSRVLDKESMIFTNFDRLGRYKNDRDPSLLSSKVSEFNKKLGIENVWFVNFIQSVLVWNYKSRPTARELLNHKFLKEQIG